MSTTCPICKMPNIDGDECCEDSFIYNCPKCGRYKISGSAYPYIESKSNLQKVSSWVSEQNKIYKIQMPYLDEDKVDSIMEQRDKTIKEKLNSLIKHIYKMKKIESIYDLNAFNHCYIAGQDELNILRNKILQDKYLANYGDYLTLSFDGIEYAEQLEEPNKNSNKIFMAFWFDPKIQEMFDDVVKPAIDGAGFLAERVSSSTTNLENKISDELIGMIKSSRAVIADCTGDRTAVYYEAGYAMGMKIPVIWTCREDQVKQICFDVNHHPFILWNTPEDLADKVVKRLKAIL